MNDLHLVSGVMGFCWLVLAALLPRVVSRYRLAAFWAMIVMGVPVLGLLTLHWGPGIGVAAFALGLCILLLQPLRRKCAGPEQIMRDSTPPGPGVT